MPPYLRRRLFRGWDWFTPRTLRHLPWRERERLEREAWKSVERHPRFWLMGKFLPLLNGFLMCFSALILFLKISPILYPIQILFYLVLSAIRLVWQRRQFRKALQQQLFVEAIRPSLCFECGYDLEGYEGSACPACDAPLLPQPDSSGSTS